MSRESKLRERLEKKQTLLSAAEDALSIILSGGVKQWTTQDGEARRMVENLSPYDLRQLISSLESEISGIEDILSGESSSSFRLGPVF